MKARSMESMIKELMNKGMTGIINLQGRGLKRKREFTTTEQNIKSWRWEP